MLLALVILPLLGAAIAFWVPSNRWRPWLLLPISAAHLALTLRGIWQVPAPAAAGWLVLDPPGRLVLLVLSVLFFICSVYSIGYLRYRTELSNRVFVACLLSFLGVTT